jgi:hypothetical protein
MDGGEGNSVRKFNRYMDKHPLLAIALGYLLIVAIVLTVIPADPASVAQALHERAT